MDTIRAAIAKLAAGLRADLTLMPLRRAFVRRLAMIEAILNEGVTNSALASALAEAGVIQRHRGSALTEGHLRQLLHYARQRRHLERHAGLNEARLIAAPKRHPAVKPIHLSDGMRRSTRRS